MRTVETFNTLQEWITYHRQATPVIKEGNDQDGYTEYDPQRYEETILVWAQESLAKVQAETQKSEAKAAVLQRLGLTAEEAKLLLE